MTRIESVVRVSSLVVLHGLLSLSAMAQGSMATGEYVGDGTDNRTVGGVGFRPDVVIVKGNLNEPAYVRTSTMDGDASRTLSERDALGPNIVQSFTDTGFVIGNDPAVNLPGIDFHWVSFRAVAGELSVGSYVGNGVDNRSITGIGFRPDYVIVIPSDAHEVWQRPSTVTVDRAFRFATISASSNKIQAFEPDGFQVGSDPDCNGSGATLHYVAWKAVAGRMAVGSYVGNGSDNRDITGIGFRPEYVILRVEHNVDPVHRPSSIGVGDISAFFNNGAHLTDGVQAFQADGFQVGSSAVANANSKTIHWMAFKDAGGDQGAEADLEVTMVVDNPTPNVGDTITYTISVRNNGPADATGVEILDILPEELTFESYSASQGSYDSESGVWMVGSIPKSDVVTLAISVTVASW